MPKFVESFEWNIVTLDRFSPLLRLRGSTPPIGRAGWRMLEHVGKVIDSCLAKQIPVGDTARLPV
jgi:hypothetical protein